MFYITEKDALKFWACIEAETNDLEKQTNKLETEVQERLAKWSYKDSFAIEWQAMADAQRNAVAKLRSFIPKEQESKKNIDGVPLLVTAINSLLYYALSDGSTSTFAAANLVDEMTKAAIRQVVRDAFAYSFKAQSVEVAA